MRHIYGWSARRIANRSAGTVAAISLPLRRRQCGEFWSRTRRQRRLRHGGHLERLNVVIDEIRFVVRATHDDVLAVHESLERARAS